MFYKSFINFVIGGREKLKTASGFEMTRDIRFFLLLRINLLVFEDKFSRNNFSVYCFEFFSLESRSRDYRRHHVCEDVGEFHKILLSGSVFGQFSIRS